MGAVALSGQDLSALRAAGPAALSRRRDRDAFWLWLSGRNFADSTMELYWEWGHRYRRWLAKTEAHPEAFTDSPARDAAVADFLGRLEQAATHNVALAAIRVFYESLGLGPVLVDRLPVGEDPHTLTEVQQARFLDAAADRSARDFALAALALEVGPWPVELRQLNVADLELTTRAGRVRLTAPDGSVRTLELTSATTWVLMGWLQHRRTMLGKTKAKATKALFVTLSSHSRIRDRDSLTYIVSEIARAAGLPSDPRVTPMTLRATVQQRLLTSGLDDVTVAARMGLTAVNTPRSRALSGGATSTRRVTAGAHRAAEQLTFDL